MTLRAVPKPTTLRDPRYLKYLRGLSCSWCQRKPPSEAAHGGGGRGIATKAPDDGAVPLCSVCHRLSHASLTPRNAETLAKRFWMPSAWSGPGVLTATSLREWMGIRARDLRAAYLRNR